MISLFLFKQAPGLMGTYPCKYCKKDVRSAGGTSSLWAHRDGSKQPIKSGHPGCSNRNEAIEAGCLLPLTVFEQRKLETTPAAGQTSITAYAHSVMKFDNKVLNQMLGMWVIRTAQPWRRVEDPYLRATFQYANPNAHLLGRMWVAKFAHEAYMEMRAIVFDELKVSHKLFQRFRWYSCVTFFCIVL